MSDLVPNLCSLCRLLYALCAGQKSCNALQVVMLLPSILRHFDLKFSNGLAPNHLEYFDDKELNQKM